ncbi:MAG: hypothetical protein HLUCCO16_08730 [Phormidium sp. OSCR]|nr:MAG: hypothetical protein HLUCCO16_08730 [Phormidium sp. OSCR]
MLNAFRQSEELNPFKGGTLMPGSVGAQRLSAIRGIKLTCRRIIDTVSWSAQRLSAIRGIKRERKLAVGVPSKCAQRLSAIRGIKLPTRLVATSGSPSAQRLSAIRGIKLRLKSYEQEEDCTPCSTPFGNQRN